MRNRRCGDSGSADAFGRRCWPANRPAGDVADDSQGRNAHRPAGRPGPLPGDLPGDPWGKALRPDHALSVAGPPAACQPCAMTPSVPRRDAVSGPTTPITGAPDRSRAETKLRNFVPAPSGRLARWLSAIRRGADRIAAPARARSGTCRRRPGCGQRSHSRHRAFCRDLPVSSMPLLKTFEYCNMCLSEAAHPPETLQQERPAGARSQRQERDR
ncbi:MAG: hypothetical protein HLUCCA08_03965 [Rhodobacteraceae bacterium HLUCCA08]|nr:MAG: hypothetical protein HLUCCA08_03965 [Rhodobacteraceae bacterium HLUCCA08]